MVVAHNKLYRNFIILQQDERISSESAEKALSGYAKVEAKGDKCKISFYAQNLKQEEDYSVVLICCKKDMKRLINLGSLKINDVGKGDISKEYYVNNIAGLGISYEKINGAAICKTNNDEAAFMMYGFINGEEPKENWKKLKIAKENNNESDDRYYNKADVVQDNPKYDSDDKLNIDMDLDSDEDDIRNKDKKCKDKHKEKCEDKCEDECKKKCEKKQEVEKEEHKKEKKHQEEKTKNDKESSTDKCKKIINELNGEEHCTKTVNYKRIQENVRMDSADFDQYERDIENLKMDSSNNFNIKGKMGEYFEKIAQGFEEYDQGLDGVNNCKWYKVPVNRVDDLFNISDYNKYTLVYYPMLNYYPYISKNKYFLLGYKCNSAGELTHIVYAIPGNKELSEQPYEGKTGYVTWTNDNNRGSGYWLMFYDFQNSTVVVPMK